jgi:hypothetical protein
MESKYKPLPRSAKFIVEFQDGLRSHYFTKNDIMKMKTCFDRKMSLSLIAALYALEADRERDIERLGIIVTVNSVGYITDLDGKQRVYALGLADPNCYYNRSLSY